MRLWHYKLIEYLPDSQLLAQWRELNSIFKNQPKHILINYVYEYPKNDLEFYSLLVKNEMLKRDFKIKSYKNANKYFEDDFENLKSMKLKTPFKNHHDMKYLIICYYNLEEKYIRGQKDFSEECWNKITALMQIEWI